MSMAQKTALLVKPHYWTQHHFCSSAEVKDRHGNKHMDMEQTTKKKKKPLQQIHLFITGLLLTAHCWAPCCSI